MDLIGYSITVPLLLGALCLFIPGFLFKFGVIPAFLASAFASAAALTSFPSYRGEILGAGVYAGPLSLVLITLTGFFGILASLYCAGRMKEEGSSFFWALLCWLPAASSGVFAADNAFLLLVSWGITGLIISFTALKSGKGSPGVWKKTFMITGGCDSFMLTGLAVIVYISGTSGLGEILVPADDPLKWVGYLCLLTAVFAKAGVFPFHTWLPDFSAESNPAVTALLPAAVNRLLAVYLLKRIAVDWFEMSYSMNLMLSAAGAVTVTAAVFMALRQHEIKRILGYHAAAQSGYMLLGIGTGTVLGVAGALLHMINNSIYKQGLFLGAGIIGDDAGVRRLDEMGGLYSRFPITFAGFAVCAAALSGLPALNGFLSKWMIYRAIWENPAGGSLRVIWFIAAVFGSVITLASFTRILHSVFLGRGSSGRKPAGERLSWELPALIILPLSCIIIGVFPYYTVFPLLEEVLGPFAVPGPWYPAPSVLFILSAVIGGLIVYRITGVFRFRKSPSYTGGDKLASAMTFPIGELYTSMENQPFFARVYGLAERGVFDIYVLVKGFVFYCTGIFKGLNSGSLNIYILWAAAGLLAVIAAAMR